MKNLDIQVAKAPKYIISDDIQSLLLVNQSLDHNFVNWDNDTLVKLMVDRELDLDTILYDSIAADTSIHTVASALFESGRYDIVVPLEHNLNKQYVDGKRVILDWDVVDSLCSNFNTDALAVQENFSQFIETDFGTSFNLELGRSIYYGTIDLVNISNWRIYKPSSRVHSTFHVRDTIFWDSYDQEADKMFSELPELKDALIEGGIVAGIDFAEQISPKWIKSTRKYYVTGKKGIDIAVKKALSGDWEEAAETWSKYSNVKSKSLRSKIEFNLALASEMTGDVEKAIEWALKSYKTYYRSSTDKYLRILDNRRKVNMRYK